MSRIDNYLQSMERFKASGLVLTSGGNVTLRFPAGDRHATQTTSHQQLQDMISEIAPSGSLGAIERGAVSKFVYEASGSRYDVSVTPEKAKWTVVVTVAAALADNSISLGEPQEMVIEHTSFAEAAAGPAPTAAPPVPSAPAAPKAKAAPPASKPAPKAEPAPAAKPVPKAPVVTAGDTVDRGTNFIDQILRKMSDAGSSDVHLSSGAPPYWRIDGNMEKIPGEALLEPDFMDKQMQAVAPPENWEEFQRRNDTDFAYEVEGLSRFRVNVFRDRRGVGTVMRTIPFEIPSAEKLGVPKAILEMANLTKGLVLVTGPTGSGKSTTLAALIDHINQTRKTHLITIEDPIEFVHENKQCLINQREVKRHTDSFKDALRAALREDPDIVLVGEMRDLETIEIAVETAETGHLVFGTLHTTTAPSTVDRIIDQFPTDRQEQIRTMLSTSLKGVVAQVLCRRIGGGRCAAHEILIGTSAVANLIREHKTFQLFSVMQTGKNLGMQKMEDSLLKLVQDGLVEPMEAYRKANNKMEFKNALERANIPLE